MLLARPTSRITHTFSAPSQTAPILHAMEALRDPFSRVHPFFWPVLWLSLRAFARWTGAMIEQGHAFAGVRVELTWYGWIHVEAIDLSETGKAFRRHMLGEPREDGWRVLARASVRVETLIAANKVADACAGRGPWTALATLAPGSDGDPPIPSCAGVGGDRRRIRRERSPPLRSAPLPLNGMRGRSDIRHPPSIPASRGRWCWQHPLPRSLGGGERREC
ncbi:MAG: hypothetical protein AAF829_01265 [Pseudomonadota bacterium]